MLTGKKIICISRYIAEASLDYQLRYGRVYINSVFKMPTSKLTQPLVGRYQFIRQRREFLFRVSNLPKLVSPEQCDNKEMV
jgi:hypothetical protein